MSEVKRLETMPETNPTRQIHRNDRWSKEAKEEDVYWLCECGVARSTPDTLMKHLDRHQHIAERIDKTGPRLTVTGIIAGGYEEKKYANQEPDAAMFNRKKNKNEPLFPR
jgi:hypothetical protein